MSGEWLEESELSFDVVHLDSPSIPIQCTINGTPFDALYNPVVGINIMALYFLHQFIKNKPLSPTTKLLKCSSGQIIQSLGILYVLELSFDVVHLDSPSIPIQCTINGTPFDALYNPFVGINIMALYFFH
jgi:replication initiation and membrane attachment protein DnaB